MSDPAWVRLVLGIACKPYRDHPLFDDIRQEALLGALISQNKIEAMDPRPCSPDRAAVQGAKWAIGDYLRRGRRENRNPDPGWATAEEVAELPAPDDVEGEVVGEEWRRWVRSNVWRGLNAEQRDVIAGLYWREETSPQIAARRGCSKQRVWRVAIQARARLREVLG